MNRNTSPPRRLPESFRLEPWINGHRLWGGRRCERIASRAHQRPDDPEGTIAKVYGKVVPADHPDEALRDLG